MSRAKLERIEYTFHPVYEVLKDGELFAEYKDRQEAHTIARENARNRKGETWTVREIKKKEKDYILKEAP
jgi:hypothetical protein